MGLVGRSRRPAANHNQKLTRLFHRCCICSKSAAKLSFRLQAPSAGWLVHDLHCLQICNAKEAILGSHHSHQGRGVAHQRRDRAQED
jgi:hypothetical protein